MHIIFFSTRQDNNHMLSLKMVDSLVLESTLESRIPSIKPIKEEDGKHISKAFYKTKFYLNTKCKMSSSSRNSATSNPPPNVPIQHEPWIPSFQIQGNPVTITDSVMHNDYVALCVGRNIVMPGDAARFATSTDAELANLSLGLSMRATTALASASHRLWQRGMDVDAYQRQIISMRTEIASLKEDRRRLRRQFKRMKELRDATVNQLNFYRDFANTKMAEFEEGMEEVQEQNDELQKTIFGNSHIPLPNGHKKSKSF